ncbi:MAG: hypothetical protein QOE08_1339 [Thermoleophilaceae bacterium]|jgi:hypothetical protein|nr:hypothetical protein [Thermoleophilaceae bacterium]
MPFLPLKSALLPCRLLMAAAIACCVCASGVAAEASAASAPATDLKGEIVAPSPAPRDIPREIVRIARAEFAKGIREVPRGSDDSAGIARYRRAVVPRPRRAAWCVFFASWVTKTAGAPLGAHGAGLIGAAGVSAWARRTGRWRHTPLPGDVAVYTGHVGIVESVSGNRMTTIDGNWSDRVSRLHRDRREAIGFARLAVGARRIGR